MVVLFLRLSIKREEKVSLTPSGLFLARQVHGFES